MSSEDLEKTKEPIYESFADEEPIYESFVYEDNIDIECQKPTGSKISNISDIYCVSFRRSITLIIGMIIVLSSFFVIFFSYLYCNDICPNQRAIFSAGFFGVIIGTFITCAGIVQYTG